MQDMDFLRYMSLRDFSQHRDLLRQKREAYLTRFPDTDPIMLHSKIDYGVYPVVFDVVVAKDSWKSIMTDIARDGSFYLQTLFPLRDLEQPIDLNHKIRSDCHCHGH